MNSIKYIGTPPPTSEDIEFFNYIEESDGSQIGVSLSFKNPPKFKRKED